MKAHHLILAICFGLALLFYVVGSSVKGAGAFIFFGMLAELWGWFEVSREGKDE
jgi:GMP synthase-like glutamine amidotransferase